MVSSAFFIWNGSGSGRKVRFVQKFHLPSIRKKKQPTKMDTKGEFASILM